MRIKTLLYSFSFFLFSFTSSITKAPLQQNSSQKIVLLIHGTFAAQEAWYQPGGDFYQALSTAFYDYTVRSYTWSGKPSYKDRLDAAKKLFNYLTTHFYNHHNLILVAHSHGVNVAIQALQECQKKNIPLSVLYFYTLAPPVDNVLYKPPMQIIKELHNLFSYGDCVQTVQNLFERTFLKNTSYNAGIITNTHIKINNLYPGHADLHHPLVAFLLPKLPMLISKKENCMIHLQSNGLMHVELDYRREQDLIFDKKFTETIVASVLDSRNKFLCHPEVTRNPGRTCHPPLLKLRRD